MSHSYSPVALYINGAFSCERWNKNQTHVVVRDALGVLASGNKKEHRALFDAVATEIWAAAEDTGNYHPVLNNVVRVFPDAEPWLRTVRNAHRPAKVLVANALESISLLTGKNGATLKGEKALWVETCKAFTTQYRAETEAKEARRVAFEEAQRRIKAERTVEGETAEVQPTE